jgi:hypothetical protein
MGSVALALDTDGEVIHLERLVANVLNEPSVAVDRM